MLSNRKVSECQKDKQGTECNVCLHGAEPDHESEKGPSEEEYAKNASYFFLVKHIAIQDTKPKD
jgi:methionyl-tRNA synthetase